MHWHGKVVWSEGMFLRPQHFQQQDRYFENFLRESTANTIRFGWGVRVLAIDDKMLERGRIRIISCSGVMPDGTPFNVPKDQDPPTELEVGETVKDRVVHLAIPLEQEGKTGSQVSETPGGVGRFQVALQNVSDNSDQRTGSEAEIRVGQLRLRLLLESDDHTGFFCVPIARIQDVSPNKKIALDPRFIPTCIDFRASARLRGFVNELEGLLHQRGQALAGSASGPEQGTVGELANFLLLQVVNRYEPLIGHLGSEGGLHPEALFKLLLMIAGELATFFEQQRRPPPYESYRHDDLTMTFDRIEIRIREYLATEFARRALQIPLKEVPQYGLFTATIHDRTLLDTASFVLAVTADIDPAEIGRLFPEQSKAGATEQISQLVNLALPGIPMRVLPVAPRQIPFNSSAVYFELDKTSGHWQELSKSGGLTFHVAGKFPNRKLELWAIRLLSVERHATP
jgi:type VI secretion system protein ImpJ